MEMLSFIITVIMSENYHTKKIAIIENSKKKIKLVHVNKQKGDHVFLKDQSSVSSDFSTLLHRTVTLILKIYKAITEEVELWPQVSLVPVLGF